MKRRNRFGAAVALATALALVPLAAAPSQAAQARSAEPADVATHNGMTWRVLGGGPGGTIHVGAPTTAESNPYSGDTPANTVLPVLCIYSYANLPVPAGITPDFYDGWTAKPIAVTQPLSGTLMTSRAAADGLCSDRFGWGWREAEFHDGHYGPNNSEVGGWTFWGLSPYLALGVTTSRFWVAIDDQSANPWN
ncbi:hypothetical protein [Kitasatospora kifunensis]|uniref:Flagellar hook-length control protein n=1 Tax=Kitasatospora kifunensis TaxID=58351 RepID=A0A7W7QWZ6_KITKI|nr:hypothetical protein [Kitasatospora kifunensis]MBB4921124.1 hypothetical protein [Kitasatospora kifunensis]